ncbi:MAG: type IV toxin-antitoxin system AbiEi family antitoxin domain-containing protein [Nitrososphaeria archaeon]
MRKSIYELRDMVKNSHRLVVNYSQLAHISGYDRNKVKVYASRLVRRGLASRLVEGVISFTSDRFVIATQLIEPSYISFTSALYVREMVTQVPVNVECVTTRYPRNFTSIGVKYHMIQPELFFGFERIERANSYIFVAKPEKVLLDSFYFSRAYPHMVNSVLKQLNRDRLVDYAERFAVTQRGRLAAKKVKEIAGIQ